MILLDAAGREIVRMMRQVGYDSHGLRVRALIAVLVWRAAGLRGADAQRD